ncbi:MAG: hypothetical protein VCF24_22460, partial [Candidatus Latescibacterota bacterium]
MPNGVRFVDFVKARQQRPRVGLEPVRILLGRHRVPRDRRNASIDACPNGFPGSGFELLEVALLVPLSRLEDLDSTAKLELWKYLEKQPPIQVRFLPELSGTVPQLETEGIPQH